MKKAAHGGKQSCQYVESGGVMHRWSGDGGCHSGAGREQTVCANIKRARVLQLLLPKWCQIEYFPWLRNPILMALKPMAQFALTYLVQSLSLR